MNLIFQVYCNEILHISVTGMRKWEVGSGTRRRPIERDYAAAKDAEGKRERS